MRNRRWLAALAVLAALVPAVLVTGCRSSERPPDLPAPAASVQQLLELRSRNSTDTAQYLRHVESTALARALVADSASRRPDEVPTPPWNRPVVSSQATETSRVKVVWKSSDKFKGWPEATIFTLRKIRGAWLVIDAVDASATAK